jgi:hypothetical protein
MYLVRIQMTKMHLPTSYSTRLLLFALYRLAHSQGHIPKAEKSVLSSHFNMASNSFIILFFILTPGEG